MSMAKQVEKEAYVDTGLYCRGAAEQKAEELGGVKVDSSNWHGESTSFSPSEKWKFPDGSVVMIEYSDAYSVAS